MKKLILLIVLIMCSLLLAAGDGKVEFNVYGTFTSPYYRLIRVVDQKIWDQEALELSFTPTYNETDVTMTANAYIVGYPIDLPSTLPAGEYDFLVYDDATPANDDTVQVAYRLSCSTGGILLGDPRGM